MSGYLFNGPGEVLALEEELPLIHQGNWVLLSIEGDEAYLSRMGENEDGDFCTTRRVVAVGLTDLSHFQPTGLILDLLE
jgi:hypothetical protein